MKIGAAAVAALPLLVLQGSRCETVPEAWLLPPGEARGIAEGVLTSGADPRLLRLPGERIAVLDGGMAWKSDGPEIRLVILRGRLVFEGRSHGPRSALRVTNGSVAHRMPPPREPSAFFDGPSDAEETREPKEAPSLTVEVPQRHPGGASVDSRQSTVDSRTGRSICFVLPGFDRESAASVPRPSVDGLTALADAIAREDTLGFSDLLARWRGRPARARALLLLAAIECGDGGLQVQAIAEATVGEAVLLQDPLRELLRRREPAVRLAAVGVLCRSGDADGIAAVESMRSGTGAGFRDRLSMAAAPVMAFLTPGTRSLLVAASPAAPAHPVPGPGTGAPGIALEDARIAAALRSGSDLPGDILKRAAALGTADVTLIAFAEASAGDSRRIEACAVADPERFLEVLARWDLPCPPERLEALISGAGPTSIRARALLALARREPPQAAAAARRAHDGGSFILRTATAFALLAEDGGLRRRQLVESVLARPFQPGAGTLLDIWARRGWTRLALESWLDGEGGPAEALLPDDRELASVASGEAWGSFDLRADDAVRRFERGRRARRRELESVVCAGLASDVESVRSEALQMATVCPTLRVLDALESLILAAPDAVAWESGRVLEAIIGRGPAGVEVTRLGFRAAWAGLIGLLRPTFQPPGEGLLPAARTPVRGSGG